MAAQRTTLLRTPPLAVLALLAVAVGAVAACDERLESGLACPALCPQQAEALRDTTLYAVDFDTSIAGYPATGAESLLVLELQPGVVDERVIVRFDSLQTTFRHRDQVGDSEIVSLDTALVKLRIARADTLGPPVTVEVYDVDYDTTGIGSEGDTTAATLVPLFSADRRIGSRTFAAESLKDSILVPIDKAKLLDKIKATDRRRLRVGLRLTSSRRVWLRIHSKQSGYPPLLFARASPDTTVGDISISAYSATPTDGVRSAELADFQLVAMAPPAPPPGVIRVGGAPARRGYLRFNVPTTILDSSSIVRATLKLTQRPNPTAPSAGDSAAVRPYELVAGGAVTDLRRALVFLAFSMDSARFTPADSAVRTFEVIEAMRRWRFTNPARTPRAMALRATLEGQSPWQADFYSSTAPAAVRPQLRITYIPQRQTGLP